MQTKSLPTGALTGGMSRSDYHKFSQPNKPLRVYAREEVRPEMRGSMRGFHSTRIRVTPRPGSVDFAGNPRHTHFVQSSRDKLMGVK